MPSVSMLNVVMLNVIKAYVVAPFVSKTGNCKGSFLALLTRIKMTRRKASEKNTLAFFDEIEKQGILKGEVSLYH
jgi:hypothetical protein